ncbi:hypothetical protein WJX72_005843 [[Myrmecia] bisecta]|uniref:Uncharacterized protein n=1 Tax=[Myrmecia] bisecta TaxID=41462 RepID=A0AAW1PSF1_9CHLO
MAMEVIRVIENCHDFHILCVAYDRGRKEVYSGSQDCLIKVWDVLSGSLVRKQAGHLGWVTDLIFTNSAKLLFSCSLDHTLMVWSDRGQALQVVEFGGAVHSLGWCGRRSTLLAGGKGEMRIYSVDANEAARASRVRMVKGDAAGVGAGRPVGSDGAKILRVMHAPLKAPDHCHTDIIRAITCTDTGVVFTVGYDKAIFIYELDRPRACRRLLDACPAGMTSAAIDNINNWLLTTSLDGSLRVWSPEGRCLDTFASIHDQAPSTCYVPMTRNYWCTAKYDRVLVYDARAPANITEYLKDVSSLDEHAVIMLRYPHGSDVVIGTTRTRQLVVWHYNAAAAYRIFQARGQWVESLIVMSVTPSDSSRIFTGNADGSIMHWQHDAEQNVEVYRIQDEMKLHESNVLDVVYCAELDALITAGEDATIRIHWMNLRVKDKRKLKHDLESMEEHGIQVMDPPAKSAPEGRVGLVRTPSFAAPVERTRSRSPAHKRPTMTQRLSATMADPGATTARRSSGSPEPDQHATTLAHFIGTVRLTPGKEYREGHTRQDHTKQEPSAFGGTTRLTPSPTKYTDDVPLPDVVLGHDARVTGLAILKDWVLASISHDQTIRLWDLHTLKLMKTVPDAHETPLQCISYCAERDEFATCAMDTFAYVWDAVTVRVKHALTGHSGEVNQVRWVEFKQCWLTASDDDTMRLWNSEGEQLMEIAYVGGSIQSIYVDNVNDLVLAAMLDKVVRVYSLDSQLPVIKYSGHTDVIRSIGYLSDKGLYVTGSWDRTLRLWYKPAGVGVALRSQPSANWGTLRPEGPPTDQEDVTVTCVPPLELPKSLQLTKNDLIRNFLNNLDNVSVDKAHADQDAEKQDLTGLSSRLAELDAKLLHDMEQARNPQKKPAKKTAVKNARPTLRKASQNQ